MVPWREVEIYCEAQQRNEDMVDIANDADSRQLHHDKDREDQKVPFLIE